jgi:hypothetical protein
MFAFLTQFDVKNARKSSLLIHFCQIELEISKETLKCSTKQCAVVFSIKGYLKKQKILCSFHFAANFAIAV